MAKHTAKEFCRASISFPIEVHHNIKMKIAEEKKVSLAGVIREAAERYVVSGLSPQVGKATARVAIYSELFRFLGKRASDNQYWVLLSGAPGSEREQLLGDASRRTLPPLQGLG